MNQCSYFIKDKAMFGCFPTQQSIEELEQEGVKFFLDLTQPEETKISPYTTKYTYINYPIGFVVYIANYNATGDGCSCQKTSIAAGTFFDWIVTATENNASTGLFGRNPAV